MLIPPTTVLAESAALSVAVPDTDWPAPCALSVTGDVQLAIPDPLSAHAKLTTTSVLFQPAAFGVGARAPVIVGAVVSTTVTLNVAEAMLLAASLAVHVTVVDPSANTEPDAAE